MTQALTELGKRPSVSTLSPKPRIMTLGGDHSLTLPALRALREIHGKPIQVLHFDGTYYGYPPGFLSDAEETRTED
jgi:agmatinase